MTKLLWLRLGEQLPVERQVRRREWVLLDATGGSFGNADMNRMNHHRFALGQLLITPGAIGALAQSGHSPLEFVGRHASGDWGEVDDDDKALNDQAVDRDERLLSAYRTARNERVWIITEADRSATTILLPEEY